MDICLSLLMLIVFGPILLTVALAIRVSGQRNVIYRHQRIGKDGKPFDCLKFTSMVHNASEVLDGLLASDPAIRREWNEHQKLENDPRIIPGLGHFLRNSSLDELPQIFNVLRGEMSIVGPRPVTEKELHRYGSYRQHYTAVKPGLTGPWQIGGRSEVTYAERVQQDVWYVENASFATDMRIFMLTVFRFVSGRLSGAR